MTIGFSVGGRITGGGIAKMESARDEGNSVGVWPAPGPMQAPSQAIRGS